MNDVSEFGPEVDYVDHFAEAIEHLEAAESEPETPQAQVIATVGRVFIGTAVVEAVILAAVIAIVFHHSPTAPRGAAPPAPGAAFAAFPTACAVAAAAARRPNVGAPSP
jgi:hypothetical protein